ncbi:helix-turn-helix domain-containing protein [Bacteroides caccae]|jgi:hypothetical protein|uniref:helix-turn-helix domain-containing protein n=1 Tax=Bacteroides caccae TaxID=47678 RepID=UPI003563D58B
MDANFLSSNPLLLIQACTMGDIEKAIEKVTSRLLDEKIERMCTSRQSVDEIPENGLYKRKDAARKLGVSLVTLDAWTKAGIIGCRRVGSRVYYTPKDIEDALKKGAKR